MSQSQTPAQSHTLVTGSTPGAAAHQAAQHKITKLLVSQSCKTSFRPRSFRSSGPTPWNDIPAHLHNSDLTLNLDSCWKPLCSGLFWSRCHVRHCDDHLLTVRSEMTVYYYYYYSKQASTHIFYTTAIDTAGTWPLS